MNIRSNVGAVNVSGASCHQQDDRSVPISPTPPVIPYIEPPELPKKLLPLSEHIVTTVLSEPLPRQNRRPALDVSVPFRSGREAVFTVDTESWNGLCTAYHLFQPLRFCSHDTSFFELTNTAEYQILVNCNKFPSPEHAIQHRAFLGTGLEQALIEDSPLYIGPSGKDAVQFGINNLKSASIKWPRDASPYMRVVVRAKFNFYDYPAVSRMLMETYKFARILVFDNKQDSLWGAGNNDTGENRLGLMLMERRAELYSQWQMLTDREKMAVNAAYKNEYPRIVSLYPPT